MSQYAQVIDIQKQEQLLLQMILAIAIITMMCCCLTFLHKHCGCSAPSIKVYKGDQDNIMTPIIFGVRTADLLSDVFLCWRIWVYCSVETKWEFEALVLSILSTAFVVIPWSVNVLISIYLVNSQKTLWLYPFSVTNYFTKYHITYLIIVMITGDAYFGLQSISSRFLSLNIFDAGITRFDFQKKKKIKLISISILEDCPQFLIVIWFTFLTNEWDTIIIITMIFTMISLLFTFLSWVMSKLVANKDFVQVVVKVYVDFEDTTNVSQKMDCRNKILFKRGMLSELGEQMALNLNMNPDELHINHAYMEGYGILKYHIIQILGQIEAKAIWNKNSTNVLDTLTHYYDLQYSFKFEDVIVIDPLSQVACDIALSTETANLNVIPTASVLSDYFVYSAKFDEMTIILSPLFSSAFDNRGPNTTFYAYLRGVYEIV